MADDVVGELKSYQKTSGRAGGFGVEKMF